VVSAAAASVAVAEASAVVAVVSEVAAPRAAGRQSPMLQRWFRHLTTTQFKLRRCFPTNVLNAIDAAITASEQAHQAEIRFAVETALPLFHLWRGVSGKERAREIFSRWVLLIPQPTTAYLFTCYWPNVISRSLLTRALPQGRRGCLRASAAG
jgi:hypothetical protein